MNIKVLIKKFKKKNYTEKFFFQGKSYKLSIKKSAYNFRFNRVNKTIFIHKNLNIVNKKMRKKIYVYNILTKKSCKNLNKSLLQIRKYNTHTLRGIYTSSISLNKRAGRVSGYM